MGNRTVALDFDGTLHPYTDGWTGEVPADEAPSPLAVEFLVMCKTRGWDVIVFSCRARDPGGDRGIARWIDKYGLRDLIHSVTSEKPVAFAYVDDRAVPFEGDWLEALEHVTRLADHPSGAAHRV